MCISEPQLLRLLAGELPEAQRLDLEAHLSCCPQCRQRFEEFQSTWNTLGQWTAPPVLPDLTQAILAAAKPSMRSPRSWLRAAAAILLASGLGISAGLAVPPRATSIARQVPTEEVVQSLGLDVLGGDTGLTDAVLELPDSHQAQERLQ